MYKVVKTFLGAPEGHTTFEYKEGEEFKERGPLLQTALEEGWVKEAKPAKQEPTVEEKRAALEKKIVGLEANLAKATDEKKKATIQKNLDAAKAELQALK